MTVLSVVQAVEAISEQRGDASAVVTMSALPFWPLRRDDYRLVSLMGGAGSIGLGLALGKPERDVWVVDGDGSLLMQLGVIPAIAHAGAPNLTHILIVNGVYAVSGAQPTPSPADWERLFLAAGYLSAHTCTTPAEIASALADSGVGPRAVVVMCSAERPSYPPDAFAIDAAAEAARVRAAYVTG